MVVEVGAGVTSVKPGDHVIPLYTPECRQCDYCLSGKTNLCQAIRETQGRGVMPDGTSRFSMGKDSIFHYMGTSTFANHTVLPEIAVAKVREDAPLRQDLLHRVRRHHRHRGGDQHREGRAGFQLRGLRPRRDRTQRHPGPAPGGGRHHRRRRSQFGQGAISRKRFGTTHFVNPSEVEGDLVPYLVDITKGGADYSFECIGNVGVMRQALECCHTRAGARASSSASPGLGRRSPRARSSSSPGGCGAAPRSEAQRAAPRCRRSSTGTWTARSTSTT